MLFLNYTILYEIQIVSSQSEQMHRILYIELDILTAIKLSKHKIILLDLSHPCELN